MITSKKTSTLAHPLLAVIALALPACSASTGDDAASAEKTGTASAAVSWVGDAYWGQYGNSGPDADIGPASSMTCFLTGVRGQLLGSTDGTTSHPEATARVYVGSNGDWFLQTHQGVGNGVNVRVACVPYTSNRVFYSSTSGEMLPNGAATGVRSVVTIPQSTSNRQCFLSGVSSWNGFNQQNAQSDTYLWAPGPTSTGQIPNAWQFITDVAYAFDRFGNQVPGGSAEAVCVDTGSVQGGVGPLSQDSVWWFTSEANIACGLTFIGGNLSYDPLGGSDGVGLFYDDGTPRWGINATSGKKAATTCVL